MKTKIIQSGIIKHPSLPDRSGGDYAQGDCQTERRRSLLSLRKTTLN
jgi:hypothetical protein